MKQINVVLEVDDDFEPGYCDSCPLSYEEWIYDEDDGYDSFINCALGSDFEHCPLEVHITNL